MGDVTKANWGDLDRCCITVVTTVLTIIVTKLSKLLPESVQVALLLRTISSKSTALQSIVLCKFLCLYGFAQMFTLNLIFT